MPSLREVRAMSRVDATKTLKSLVGTNGGLNVGRVLDSVYSLPLIAVDNVKLSHIVDKVTGMTTGELNLEVSISHEAPQQHQNRNDSNPLSLALVLGTPQRKTLLTHQTINFGRGSGAVKKSVNLTFDWNSANADGGEGGGAVILRLLLEDVRGLDSELTVPLR